MTPCPQCRFQNREGVRFCEQCGAKLELLCSACGTVVPPDRRFCGSCGQPLGASGARPGLSEATPRSYTPPHLAEKILTSRAALEGERKQVTVLLADLKGSMELLADRDPEDARKILDPVLERMMEAVHHYEGTVNQVMGDGIMALFGAPVAHEDHAARACYAALRMQDAVKRHSEEVRRNVGVPVSIRVGLNSGEVVVRSIGSDLHMDYTAVGQTTHLAARMEQAALPGSILISADTLRLAEGYVQVRPLGQVNVKGLAEPVEMYEVVGAGPVRTRFQAAAARGLTRFVGRDAEMEQLHRALQLAGDGRGQAVAVVGEAGVGKSRLFYEFTHSHRTQGWLILESGSVSYGKATSYLPVIDLLKAYFKIQDRDDHREIRDKVIGRVLGLDRSLEPLLPALLALLDIPVEDPQWQALDPRQRRQRTLDAVKRLLLRESQVQPLLVIFEDLHWIDSETQTLLDGLIDRLSPARLLLLVNYRPEYQHAWGSKTYYSQLRLDALPPESTDELLQALLGDDPGLGKLKQLLIKRGNPFFIEESVRTLVETKTLVGERGAYRLARPVETIQVPTTVQTILAARIDRLPVEEKQLLQAASVIGKDVPFAVLQAIAELPGEVLRRGLGHLQAAEFVYETSLFPDLEYTFKHALTHEVAYASLLQERRRALHARIVEATERLYADRLVEHVERLGHHAVRGQDWAKALKYLRQAGAKALDRSANREAVAWFEQALEALQHLPESRDTIEQAFDLRIDLRTSLLPLAKLSRILDVLQEAEALALLLHDEHRLSRIASLRAVSLWLMGDNASAAESAERALAIATELGDFGLRVPATNYLGYAFYALGNYRRASALLKRNVASLEGDLLRERFGQAIPQSVNSRTYWVWCLSELGEFGEGVARGEEAIRIAEAVDHPYTRVWAYVGIGHLYLRKGDYDEAKRVLEPALKLCEAWNFLLVHPLTASSLGCAYSHSGRIADAIPLLEQAVEQAGAHKIMLCHSLEVGWLSEAYLLAGRHGDAMQSARRALDLVRAHKERGHEAWAHRLLGEIHAHPSQSDLAKAEASYREAVAIATELGMRPLVAHCHLGLGRLYRRTGKGEQAHELLSTASGMYREMDMRFWLEKAEAELGAVR